MTETAETLRERGGIDLTKLEERTIVWVETTAGIYKLTIADGSKGEVVVEATESPFQAGKPCFAILQRSMWDDKGKVFIEYWIGHAMRMVFEIGSRGLFATHSVKGAKIEASDGSWHWEMET